VNVYGNFGFVGVHHTHSSKLHSFFVSAFLSKLFDVGSLTALTFCLGVLKID